MERNTDENIVVLDKDMYRRLVQYAKCGEADCGEGFFGKTVKEIEKHARRFNSNIQEQHDYKMRQDYRSKEEKRQFIKKARRLLSQRDTVRYMVDHDMHFIFPVQITGASSLGEHRIKYRSLSDGWESEASANHIYETREELPASYYVVKEGEKVE